MDIGFSGSRSGMTKAQRSVIFGKLTLCIGLNATTHHGECVGADAEFHGICLSLSIPVIGHPPINEAKKAKLYGFLYEWEPKEYLDRNKDIVRCAKDLLIATPGEFEEQLRSGTWSTIRFARKTRVPLYIIFPDGTVKEDNE